MYSLALRMLGSDEDARDAVQDAFSRLLEHRAELDGVESPQAYCVTLTRRICIDRLRRRASAMTVSITEATLPAESESVPADEDALGEEQILRAIDKLPPGQVAVIRLRAFDNLDNEGIARETGLSPGAVRQTLSRARRRLKELLRYSILMLLLLTPLLIN